MLGPERSHQCVGEQGSWIRKESPALDMRRALSFERPGRVANVLSCHRYNRCFRWTCRRICSKMLAYSFSSREPRPFRCFHAATAIPGSRRLKQVMPTNHPPSQPGESFHQPGRLQRVLATVPTRLAVFYRRANSSSRLIIYRVRDAP